MRGVSGVVSFKAFCSLIFIDFCCKFVFFFFAERKCFLRGENYLSARRKIIVSAEAIIAVTIR